MTTPAQASTDRANASFWSELCGTSIAVHLGLTGDEPDTLERYDAFYFDYYPYLKRYVDPYDLRGRDILEIGLGYGTLGQYLAERGGVYHGLDIAPTPVAMMRERLKRLGVYADGRVTEGSALAIPFPDNSFDYVFSIGCLHHSGNLQLALDETRRVLRPAGRAVIMLYNQRSVRQLWSANRLRLASLLGRGGQRSTSSEVRAWYDADTSGAAAPHTDFVTRNDVRHLMSTFDDIRIEAQNLMGLFVAGHRIATRERLIRSPLARLFGLDLYITATKAADAATVTPSIDPENEKAGT